MSGEYVTVVGIGKVKIDVVFFQREWGKFVFISKGSLLCY